MTKTSIQKITPFLSFDQDAEEAAKFYTSIFKNSKIIDIAYYGKSAAAKFYTSIFKNSKIIDIAYYGKSAAEATGRPEGTVMLVRFELEGQLFMALNGPDFKFSQPYRFW